jgi:hypothetical protein
VEKYGHNLIALFNSFSGRNAVEDVFTKGWAASVEASRRRQGTLPRMCWGRIAIMGMGSSTVMTEQVDLHAHTCPDFCRCSLVNLAPHLVLALVDLAWVMPKSGRHGRQCQPRLYIPTMPESLFYCIDYISLFSVFLKLASLLLYKSVLSPVPASIFSEKGRLPQSGKCALLRVHMAPSLASV